MSLQSVARLALAFASLFLAGAAPGQPFHGPPPGPGGPPFGGPPGPGGFIEEYAERLGFDDETRAAVRAIVEASHADAAELREEHHEARLALQELLFQDAPDEAIVLGQAERLGRIETEMMQHRLRTMLRIHGLLSPKQREELMAIRRERHAEGLHDACTDDLETLCPDADGFFDQVECLRENADRVSKECASTLETARRGRGFRRGRFGR
jgi:Spy/CpxP family protein refolding chaperone